MCSLERIIVPLPWCLSVCPSVCLGMSALWSYIAMMFVCLSVCLSGKGMHSDHTLPWCLSVCPSVCLGRACILIMMFVSLSLCLSGKGMHSDHTVHFKHGLKLMVDQSNVLGTLTAKHVHLFPAVLFQFHLEERWGVDVQTKEYLSRVATRVETNGPAGYKQRNLGQMCHALVHRSTEQAQRTMPLITLELSDTESWNFTHI